MKMKMKNFLEKHPNFIFYFESFIIVFLVIMIFDLSITQSKKIGYKQGQIDFQKGIVYYKVDGNDIWEVKDNASKYGQGQLDAQDGKIVWKVEEGKIWNRIKSGQ